MSEKDRIIKAASALAVYASKQGLKALTATDDGKIVGARFGSGQVEIKHAIPPDIFERSVALAGEALRRKHAGRGPSVEATGVASFDAGSGTWTIHPHARGGVSISFG